MTVIGPFEIDFLAPAFVHSVLVTAFIPTWWNVMARSEYRTHWITKLAGGAYRGCYTLALLIFLLGGWREYAFNRAVETQPKWDVLDTPLVQDLAYLLIVIGSILVGATYYRLGITGTYLGDYFGILMSERVTGFPFSVLDDPMYDGSSLIYVAQALLGASPAGLALALWVFIVYRIAIIFEGDFTNFIYSQASKDKNKND